MWNRRSWTAAALVLAAGLCLTACATSAGTEPSAEKPAKVEKASGAETAKLTLTDHAVKRLDIKTVTVTEEQIAGQKRTVIPYAAVLYDAKGQAWTFTNPQPLTYVRERISVEQITKDKAVLSSGPATGTNVVTVGATELYGAELGVGK